MLGNKLKFMNDPLFSVKDQVVLISGASRGIGRAIAQAFAERNAQVIITGRNIPPLEAVATKIGATDQRVTAIQCDVAAGAETSQLIETVVSRFSRIDTLINVAGVNRRKPAETVTEDDYDFILDINLKGAFQLSQKAGLQMIAQGGGCQINIASLNTDRPLKNVLPYAMSKSALGQMTRSLAMEWGDRGIRVNALAPGFILTDLTEKLWSDPTMQEWGRTNTPMGRLGRPIDMVGTAVFLASPASAFMTGQILYVDGGFTAGWAWPIPE
ncbi:MAG: Gluconate 5-dehydrogenase [Verrucomicrobia subdivision 3 bacterium]|nr:Gluconate 5-dehydrogenase [Limisphaerales bacterium]MCS1415760.1 Gluconate 5-dehydrogenase [Limisphaerales bacterium]